MKCKCGKEASIYARGENQCWACYHKQWHSLKSKEELSEEYYEQWRKVLDSTGI